MNEFFLYLGGLLLLLFAGLHVSTVLFLLAMVGAVFIIGGKAWLVLGHSVWSTMNSFILVAVPLFILAGEILLRSGVADRMYRALSLWLSGLPGGLLHTNIGACALFSASSGSSVATAATIGTVALPSLVKRGYNKRLALGSLAAGGTLGILIPPSINMIIFGALANVSIGRLFTAGIIPGLILAALFMFMILLMSLLWRGHAVRREAMPPLAVRLRALVDLVPPLFIFAIVMGSIYFGWATPTEAAALAVIASLVLAAIARRLSIRMLHAAFRGTLRTAAMAMLIIIAAFYLNYFISLLGMTRAIVAFVDDLGISPAVTIILVSLMYIVLGCFMETLSMMITTIPVAVPLIVGLGLDPVWFGIFLTLHMELSLITPPVGMNLYVIQGIRRDGGKIHDVFIGCLPFAGSMFILIVLLGLYPGLALWLPNKLFG